MATIESNTAKIDFKEYVQDTLIMAFRYTDEEGNLIDVTGWDVDLELRKQATDPVPLLLASIQNGIVLGSTDYNICVTITDTQTQLLGPGTFTYFIRTKDVQGFVNTMVLGKITLRSR